MSFIHLQLRSAYSLLGSSINLSELIEFAKSENLTTLALVEDGAMHSAIKFYKACEIAQIKPIIGLTLKVKIESFNDEWTILAKNKNGYQALLKFASIIAINENGIEIEDILQAAEHLIICTSGEEGFATMAIETRQEEKLKTYYEAYLNKIPYLYIGLSRVNARTFELSKQLLTFANEIKRPVVALNDIRYLKKEDENTYHFLQAIKRNETFNPYTIEKENRYYILEEQMKELFEDCPEALTATVEIASLCQLEIPLTQKLLPKYPTPDQVPSSEYLEALCQKGLQKRYGEKLDIQIFNRLKYELSVIEEMGFSDYFLVVWDFVKYAKINNIAVGPGRGSAAGSLVSYVLGITNVDPIKYELIFERFLNPERVSMPDIDIDFQDNRRDEVIQYVQEKYGEKGVVQITTFGTFKSRSAWRDLARIHEIETKLINQVSNFLYSGSNLETIYYQNEELRSFLQDYPKLDMIYKAASKIERLPRHTSVHAAGVIISDRDLTDYTAIMEGPTGIFLSQYEAEDLEAIGLLKMDFLGLKNLTIIQQIMKLINQNREHPLHLNEMNFDDKATYQLISNGYTTGVFQLESEGMRQVLKAVKPTNLEDVIACNALFRPGPMENIPLFAARKNGEQTVEYDHPNLVPVLEKTYGIIVYQEQIMQLAHIISGYSLGEADVLRRAVSKKKKNVLEREEQHFIKNAVERGYPKEIAEKVYGLILKFANYGFNRSHAVAYSMIAYQMAFLKVHYPCYFMTVALTGVIGSERSTAQYIKEAKQLGIRVFPPSINKSNIYYEVEGENIRFSLLPIKNIGHNLVKQIVLEREKSVFQSFYDFVIRTKKFMNQKTYESLIDVGALDEFGYNRATLHHNLLAILDFSKYDGGLFEMSFEIKNIMPDFEQTEIMKREKELLGFYLNSHPVSFIRNQVYEKGWYLPSDLLNLKPQPIVCVGFVDKVREIRDKNGNLMAFMEISDETISITVTIFSKIYQPQYRTLVGTVIGVQGTLTYRNNEINVNLTKIIPLSTWK